MYKKVKYVAGCLVASARGEKGILKCSHKATLDKWIPRMIEDFMNKCWSNGSLLSKEPSPMILPW